MADMLDLDLEWGAIDLTEELEAIFDFTISGEEAERCSTVGDLYDVLCARTPDWEALLGILSLVILTSFPSGSRQ